MQFFIMSESSAGVERLSTPANKVGSGLEVDPFLPTAWGTQAVG